jgi:hypothetical protein
MSIKYAILIILGIHNLFNLAAWRNNSAKMYQFLVMFMIAVDSAGLALVWFHWGE